jgi:hypothetical protein
MLYSCFIYIYLHIFFTPALCIICIFNMFMICIYVCVCVCVCVYALILLCIYALLVVEFQQSVYGQRAYKATYYITARVIAHKCGACGATLDLSMPPFWPSRECVAKGGAEERWRMGAWRVAAEASWSSTATRTGSCLSTDACRCCAGTYSPAGAAACVTCTAGERCSSYDALLPNLVSVRITEADARRE